MHSWFVIENCLRHQIIICSNWRESKIVLDIFSKVMSVHLLWILMKEFINKTLLSNAFPDCLLVIIGKGHYWEWKIIVRLWKSVVDCYTIYWRRQNTSDLQMLNVFCPQTNDGNAFWLTKTRRRHRVPFIRIFRVTNLRKTFLYRARRLTLIIKTK